MDGRRPVTAKVDKAENVVTFHFKDEEDREFYFMPLNEYMEDQRFYRSHMLKKSWFSQGMEDFIVEHAK